MYMLRDKDGVLRATLDDVIVGKIMSGNAGEFKERNLVKYGKVIVYEITCDNGNISTANCIIHLNMGDYLRRT